MSKFTDKITIRIEAGHGGPGAVSFRREKYIPRGGPDGGDGGKGGDVYIKASASHVNLSHLFKDRIYKAEKGSQGMGQNKYGKDGSDLIVPVPIGTQVIDAETGELLSDLLKEDEMVQAAAGGIGGKGNAFFKSSTHQAPKFSQPGMPGEAKILDLNLKLIADIGLVGLPNIGKSTLLSVVTNATPKIADYPFTTLTPNLGVVEMENGGYFKIADIPGIIEGAHEGHGLGLSFLRHIERVKAILFMIDSTEPDPLYNLQLLRAELKTYNEELVNKPYYIVISRSDLINDDDLKKKIGLFKEDNVIAVSSLKGVNIPELIEIMENLI